MQKILIKSLGSIMVLLAILWALNVHRYLGFNLFKGQYLYVLIALAIPVVFMTKPLVPTKPSMSRLVDVPLTMVGVLSALYIAWNFETLIDEATLYDFQLRGMLLGGVMMVVLWEGVRRTAGLSLALIVAVSVLLAVFAGDLPEPFTGQTFAYDDYLYQMGYMEGNILGAPISIVGTVVIAFVLMGSVLTRTGGGQFFSDIAAATMGGARGGSAKIAVTASGLFGSISGSAVSNVISTGMITIPMMRKAGYKAETAAGLEAVASTGGQLVPPVMGAAAFLMAVTAEVDYTAVVIAALIPAFLYYLALFLQIDLIAGRDGIKGVPAEERPSARDELRHGWLFILPFVVLIVGLFALVWRPEFAALMSTLSLVIALYVFGFKGNRPKLRDWLDAIADTATASVGIIFIAACAGIVIGSLNSSGVLFKLTEAIIDLGGTNLPLLLALAAVLCIILGMGMPTVGVYALLSTLVAAPLVKLGIFKISAHLFVLYFGMMSLITPPVAVASFAAASLANTPAMKTGWRAVGLAWSAYVIPFVFVANPALIMEGGTADIIVSILRAAIGVWLVSACIVGYLNRPLGAPLRLGYIALGIWLLAPPNVFPEAVQWILAIGSLLLGAVTLVLEFGVFRRRAVENV